MMSVVSIGVQGSILFSPAQAHTCLRPQPRDTGRERKMGGGEEEI